ncbi:2-methylcitrate dehydratase [Alsobacter soli]|uniref:2-methylcitrate dehydratase n=1 Tax=Alsobacter soli TaxID=2109933 RepID=A0A2T1HR60_9HYPH|nr:MmgE/PrpD family protein [Alsobacter soli]PSC04144.1 2-methylcitrate dehydratase [Alsobacter soli]
MQTIAFIHDLRFEALPADVAQQARRCLLDLVGVAASGRSTRLSRIAHGFAARQMGAAEGGARLLFDGRRVSPTGAAFAGAATIDSFDAHDGHPLTKGHAGVTVLPALLAVADAGGNGVDEELSGAEALAALVMGYEIAIRAGIALHGSAADYHTSGAWNAIAAAAVGARLLRLDSMTTRHALGVAEYHGPRSQMMRCIDHPTMVKDGSAWGALAGVSAAYLAADGFTGAPAITIEAPEQHELWDDLGSRWRILEQYFKPWPICRWAQPAVEAAAGLVKAHGVAPEAIEAVEVASFAEAVRLGTTPPADTEAAQYALGFPLAAYLARGRLGAEEVGDEGLRDPAVRSLLARISLREDPALSAQFPARRLAAATIRLRNGAVLASPVTPARGDADAPLSDDELEAKFRDLSVSLGDERTNRIVQLVRGLGPNGPALGALLELLAPPAAESL